MRRAFDVTASLSGLIALAPLLGLIAIAVRLDSTGPALFRQQRVGRAGRLFWIYKFRSMRVARPNEAAPQVTVSGDSRVTRMGRWLRRTKLDELPQLWNVLRGDMGLVGPRPESPTYVVLYTPQQRRVLEHRPGITCVSSLSMLDEERVLAEAEDPEQHYRDVVMPAKLDAALSYASRATVWSDLAVIFRTVLSVARRETADARRRDEPRCETVPMSIRAGSTKMVGARAAQIAAQVGVLISVAWCCGLADVGRFALAGAVTAPLFMLGNLQLRVLYATDAANEFPLWAYTSLRHIGVSAAFLVAITVGCVLPDAILGFLLVACVASIKVGESLGDLQFGRLQRHNRSDLIAAAIVLRACIGLVVFATAIGTTSNLELGCATWLASSVICLLLFEYPAARRVDPQPEAAAQRMRLCVVGQLARRATPLGLATALMSLSYNTPRYVVAGTLGPVVLGSVAPLLQLIPICQALSTAACYPWMPVLATINQRDGYRATHRQRQVAYRTAVLAALAVTASVGAMAPSLLTRCVGPGYAVSHSFAAGIGLAAGLQIILTALTTVVRSLRMFGRVLAVEAITLVANAVLGVSLVLAFGVGGIAAATPLAAIVSVAAYWVALRLWIDRNDGAESTSPLQQVAA